MLPLGDLFKRFAVLADVYELRDSYFDNVCGSEICAGVCICEHIQRPEEDAGVLLCHMSPSATETESLTEPGASLATNKLLLLLRSNSPSQSRPLHSTGVRVHACTINTLTFKSSLLSLRDSRWEDQAPMSQLPTWYQLRGEGKAQLPACFSHPLLCSLCCGCSTLVSTLLKSTREVCGREVLYLLCLHYNKFKATNKKTQRQVASEARGGNHFPHKNYRDTKKFNHQG